jgi:hypothetical protein
MVLTGFVHRANRRFSPSPSTVDQRSFQYLEYPILHIVIASISLINDFWVSQHSSSLS